MVVAETEHQLCDMVRLVRMVHIGSTPQKMGDLSESASMVYLPSEESSNIALCFPYRRWYGNMLDHPWLWYLSIHHK